MKENKLVALITNNDDDIDCFRKELIQGLIAADIGFLFHVLMGPNLSL